MMIPSFTNIIISAKNMKKGFWQLTNRGTVISTTYWSIRVRVNSSSGSSSSSSSSTSATGEEGAFFDEGGVVVL
jgi:hypothetical protein